MIVDFSILDKKTFEIMIKISDNKELFTQLKKKMSVEQIDCFSWNWEGENVLEFKNEIEFFYDNYLLNKLSSDLDVAE